MIRITGVILVTLGLLLVSPAPASAGPRDFAICLPLGEGSSALANRYLPPFFRHVEKRMGWPTGSMKGKYFTSISACARYVSSKSPGFGLLSQGLYLERRRSWKLRVLGRVDMPRGAGTCLHLVVRKGSYASLNDLQGKKLKSNHVAEKRFLSKVIFKGKVNAQTFFNLASTYSPLMGFKSVFRNRADATLVNPDELKRMRGRKEGRVLKVIYSSPILPGTPVVAFRGNASGSDMTKMKRTLPRICSGAGRRICTNAMIRRFRSAGDATYRKLVRMFGR